MIIFLLFNNVAFKSLNHSPKLRGISPSGSMLKTLSIWVWGTEGDWVGRLGRSPPSLEARVLLVQVPPPSPYLFLGEWRGGTCRLSLCEVVSVSHFALDIERILDEADN